MPNKNYLAGRKKEYRICNQLKEEGFNIVQRSAGSHSPVDVWAVHIKRKLILLIQSKPDNFRLSQREIINNKNHDLNGKYTVKFQIR